MKEAIQEIILTVLKEIGDDIGDGGLKQCNAESSLFGEQKILESLHFIRFIADVEERVTEQYDCDVMLLDGEALSREDSPFATVKSLTLYIEKLIKA